MKAHKATINYGGIELEVYMMPDGSYQLSKTQVAQAIEKGDTSFRDFLDGKSPEALPYKDFTPAKVETDLGSRIQGIPIKVAIAYWTYWSSRGNIHARALLAAGTEESFNRRCDTVFNNEKSEDDYNKMTLENIDQNKILFEMMKMLTNLSEEVRQQREDNNELKETNKLMLERTKKLDDIEEATKEHQGIGSVLEHEINEAYPFGTCYTAESFLEEKQVNMEVLPTLRKRAAQFALLGKHGKVSKNKQGQNIYCGSTCIYLEEALKSILGLY